MTWPLAARAQQGKLYRIGILSPERPPPELLEAFQQALRELGYVEGKNVSFEIRNAEGDAQRLATFAGELVGLKVDAILAVNTSAAQAAKNATATIPIVITRLADPMKSGLVMSLARPGGNVTGVSFISDELSAKRLEMLKEALPSVSRIAAVWYEGNPGAAITVDQMEGPARELGLKFLRLPVRGRADFDAVCEAANRERVQALIVVDDAVMTRHRRVFLELATNHGLPVVALYKSFATAGALLAYGPSTPTIYRRAAYYVDRILKGANPGDLPVEQPTKFDLFVNLKTAKALNLTIAATFLARADEVIE